MNATQIAVLAAAVVVLVFGYEAEVSMAAAAAAPACNPRELSPCLDPITKGTPPSQLCCAKMKQQQRCFCTYLKNPSLKQYVRSPRAKTVITTCRVSVPKC